MSRDPYYPIATEELPRNWTSRFVGDVADVKSGFPSGRHNDDGRGVPHLRPMNIDKLGRIDLSELKFVPLDAGEARIRTGDVLFNNTNSPALVGKTAHFNSPGEYGFSNHMTRVAPDNSVDAKFLAYQLHYLWMTGYFRHHCINHVNQASISSGTLARAVPVVFPDTEEQQRIVSVVECLFSRLDSAERTLQHLLPRVDGFLERTYALALDGRWPVAKLMEIAQTSAGGTPLRRRPEFYGGAIHWVKSGELRDGLVQSTEETITNEGLHSTSARIFKRGTLLMAMYGATIGKIGILDLDGAATNQAVCAIEPFDPLFAPYLRVCLRALRRKLISLGQGGAQPNISQQIIKNLDIPLPTQDWRDQMVALVDRCADLTLHTGGYIERALKQSMALRRSILSRAFSASLDLEAV